MLTTRTPRTMQLFYSLSSKGRLIDRFTPLGFIPNDPLKKNVCSWFARAQRRLICWRRLVHIESRFVLFFLRIDDKSINRSNIIEFTFSLFIGDEDLRSSWRFKRQRTSFWSSSLSSLLIIDNQYLLEENSSLRFSELLRWWCLLLSEDLINVSIMMMTILCHRKKITNVIENESIYRTYEKSEQ